MSLSMRQLRADLQAGFDRAGGFFGRLRERLPSAAERRMRRRSVGVDMSGEYLDVAARRLAGTPAPLPMEIG